MTYSIIRKSGGMLAVRTPLVDGNRLALKIERVHKGIELNIVADSPRLAVRDVSHNARSDTWFFTVQAKDVISDKALAKITVSATEVPRGRSFPVLSANFELFEQIELPRQETDASMLVRLFLMEAPSPLMQAKFGYTREDTKLSMQYMKCVIQNRLDNNPKQFGAAGAASYRDIVRAPGQFAAFEGYSAAGFMHNHLLNIMAEINNATKAAWKKYREFYADAVEVAGAPVIANPPGFTPYFWRTQGSGSPGGRADTANTRTIAGNVFYGLKDG
ncbi:MAG: hypothetical protein LBV45_08035 [Xanthomonadaceae bacterium]|jgi:hypothetical protein|nr:hypothetical protein [Xanthomonadaceae bacterium]